MRKALALFLAVLVFCTAGFLSAHCIVNAQKDNVTWEEVTLYGEKSKADGLYVCNYNEHRNNLLWKTEGMLGENLNPVTEFQFSNVSIYFPDERTYYGLEMYANDSIASLATVREELIPQIVKEKYPELADFCKEAYNSVELGEEKYFTLNLRDYMDYYSYALRLDISQRGWSYGSEFETNYELPDEFIAALHDYFKIPIAGDCVIEFSINKENYGNSYGTSLGGSMIESNYWPHFNGCYVNDTCYFTFNSLNDNGDPVDLSLLPEGYGIYRLNYSFDEDGVMRFPDPVASLVCPLDPTEGYLSMSYSDDEKHLYVETTKDGDLYRTVIDIATMEVVQKIILVEDQPEDFFRELHQYDDFLVILQFSHHSNKPLENSVTVFSEDEKGIYHHVFTVPMNDPNCNVYDDLNLFCVSRFQMDFNGETLAVIQNEYTQEDVYGRTGTALCNFLILTYDVDGLGYAGRYKVNLTEASSDPENDDYACHPFYDAPVSVTWQ